MKTSLLVLLVTSGATAGCSATNSCVPGQSVACACAGGASGAQACQTDGTFAACDCGGGQQDGGRSLVTPDLGSTFTVGAKRIFITSATYSGNLQQAGGGTSGLAGADALCNSAASGAALGGEWKAWLSDGTSNALDRITDVGPWFTLSGAKAFNNKANLTTTPLSVLSITEHGTPFNGGIAYVWTGTQSGGMATLNHCQKWTRSDIDSGTIGAADDQTDWTFLTGDDAHNCGESNHLYCLEQ